MALSAFGSRNRRVSRSVSGRAKRKTRNDFHWIVDRAVPVLTESPEPLYLFVFSYFWLENALGCRDEWKCFRTACRKLL
ncbi:hypothetical protein I5770_13195 [Brucella sp. BO2]|nr:hypothetical protein I5770_13195 [Brucella sp. BO2]